MRLYVQNQTEEFVCNIVADPSVAFPPDSNTSGSMHTGPATGKLLVVSYTRDSHIPGPNYELKCYLRPASTEDERKFKSFFAYIQDRKKIAVIKVENNLDLLFGHFSTEPPAAEDTVSMPCYVKRKLSATLPARIIADANTSSGEAYNPIKSSVPPQKPVAPSASVGGFLGKLLEKIEVKASYQPLPVVDAMSKANEAAALEASTRKLLREFLDNTLENEFAMEPMEKSSRYIVHEIVDEFAGIVSASVGDDDDRHVVIYRQGFEPPDVQLNISADVARKGMTAIKRKPPTASSSKAQPSMAAAAVNISKVESEKRDRRSIEEIQRDMKRRKVEDTSN